MACASLDLTAAWKRCQRSLGSAIVPILLLEIQSYKLIPNKPFYVSQLEYFLLQKEQLKYQNLL